MKLFEIVLEMKSTCIRYLQLLIAIVVQCESDHDIFFTFFRLVIIAVVLLLLSNKSSVVAMYKVKATKDKALFGYSFLNLTDTAMHMDRCLAMCLQDCRCMSFQICKDQMCQLCSTNKDLNPSALAEAQGCMNFFFYIDFEKVSKVLVFWKHTYSQRRSEEGGG